MSSQDKYGIIEKQVGQRDNLLTPPIPVEAELLPIEFQLQNALARIVELEALCTAQRKELRHLNSKITNLQNSSQKFTPVEFGNDVS